MNTLLNFIKKLRVSTFVFLLVIPGIVYLFINARDYQDALEFIVPGIWMTVFVAVGAYLTSALLGLILAGLSSFKKGKRTLLYFRCGRGGTSRRQCFLFYAHAGAL